MRNTTVPIVPATTAAVVSTLAAPSRVSLQPSFRLSPDELMASSADRALTLKLSSLATAATTI